MDNLRRIEIYRGDSWIWGCERPYECSHPQIQEFTIGIPKDPDFVGFRWLGVGGVELSAGGQVLAIDPFFTRPRFSAMWGKRVSPDRSLIAARLPRCDFVLVTHAHYDHLMDVPEILRSSGATAYGSPNTCQILSAAGIPAGKIHEIGPGSQLELGVFKIEAGKGYHGRTPLDAIINRPLSRRLKPPLRLWDYCMDTCLSFHIRVNGLRIQHGEQPNPAEVLLINPNKAPEHYQALVQRVQPRLVLPIHWDNFFSPLTRPLRPMFAPPRWGWPPIRKIDLVLFKRQVEESVPQARVLVPEIFRTYDLMQVNPNRL